MSAEPCDTRRASARAIGSLVVAAAVVGCGGGGADIRYPVDVQPPAQQPEEAYEEPLEPQDASVEPQDAPVEPEDAPGSDSVASDDLPAGEAASPPDERAGDAGDGDAQAGSHKAGAPAHWSRSRKGASEAGSGIPLDRDPRRVR